MYDMPETVKKAVTEKSHELATTYGDVEENGDKDWRPCTGLLHVRLSSIQAFQT